MLGNILDNILDKENETLVKLETSDGREFYICQGNPILDLPIVKSIFNQKGKIPIISEYFAYITQNIVPNFKEEKYLDLLEIVGMICYEAYEKKLLEKILLDSDLIERNEELKDRIFSIFSLGEIPEYLWVDYFDSKIYGDVIPEKNYGPCYKHFYTNYIYDNFDVGMVKYAIEKEFNLKGKNSINTLNIWAKFDDFKYNKNLIISLFKHGIGLEYREGLRFIPIQFIIRHTFSRETWEMIVKKQVEFGGQDYGPYISIIIRNENIEMSKLLMDNINLEFDYLDPRGYPGGYPRGYKIIHHIYEYGSPEIIEYSLSKNINKDFNLENNNRIRPGFTPFKVLSINRNISKEFIESVAHHFE